MIINKFKKIKQVHIVNQLSLTRVTLKSLLRLTNPWRSDPRSNWNLQMLVFDERGKLDYPEKTSWSKDENQQQTQPTLV